VSPDATDSTHHDCPPAYGPTAPFPGPSTSASTAARHSASCAPRCAARTSSLPPRRSATVVRLISPNGQWNRGESARSQRWPLTRAARPYTAPVVRFAVEPSRATSGVPRTTKRRRADGKPGRSSAAESPHARHAPARRPQPRVPPSGNGWAAFADTVPISGGRIENPAPLRGPHLVFCHVIAGAWNVRLTTLFDQDGVAGEPPPLLPNTPCLRVRLRHAAIRRAGASHADDVVASLAAHLFHVNESPI
jgi:hypothetical protein